MLPQSISSLLSKSSGMHLRRKKILCTFQWCAGPTTKGCGEFASCGSAITFWPLNLKIFWGESSRMCAYNWCPYNWCPSNSVEANSGMKQPWDGHLPPKPPNQVSGFAKAHEKWRSVSFLGMLFEENVFKTKCTKCIRFSIPRNHIGCLVLPAKSFQIYASAEM